MICFLVSLLQWFMEIFLFCSVTEVQEGTEYNVSFNAGGNELCLRVLLTKDFPKEKPILKISPVVAHSWVNGDGDITTAPGLLNVWINCLSF